MADVSRLMDKMTQIPLSNPKLSWCKGQDWLYLQYVDEDRA